MLKKLSAAAIAGLLYLNAPQVNAAEIATDPGDYVPLPAGINLGILYVQHATRDAFFANDAQVPGNNRLDTTIGLARFVHYMDIGGYIVDPQIIIPFGKVDLKTPFGPLPATSESGIGDPLVGATAWFVNNPANKEYLGLSAFASVPVGDYDAQKGPVNLGQDRWKGIYQVGYVKGLGDKFIVDLIGEYATYGKQDNFLGFEREQDDSQSAQAHLRYLLSESSHLALSFYQDFGGETSLGGTAQNDELDTNRWLATYSTFIEPTIQLQFQYGQDIDVKNGFKEDQRLNFRVVKVF
ncbi:transporter [Limnobacter sp.]|uniref:transporter n=1 Tax=Limnobacter sp. TaxID=2003368 RepID=UPI0025C57037|nr:transporter [Limnobacter sp.]